MMLRRELTRLSVLHGYKEVMDELRKVAAEFELGIKVEEPEDLATNPLARKRTPAKAAIQPHKNRELSAEARQKIADAQKKRWAAFHKAKRAAA